jgi:hypothetical protein
MNTTTTTVTNITNGVITRITTVHHSHFSPGLLILALVAAALIAYGLRAVFWNKGP